MSYEAWGDGDDGEDYDRLLDAGWWTSEQVEEVIEAIKALRRETIYEDGQKDKGISVQFLMRMTLLDAAAGLVDHDDPIVVEAREYFASATPGHEDHVKRGTE